MLILIPSRVLHFISIYTTLNTSDIFHRATHTTAVKVPQSTVKVMEVKLFSPHVFFSPFVNDETRYHTQRGRNHKWSGDHSLNVLSNDDVTINLSVGSISTLITFPS